MYEKRTYTDITRDASYLETVYVAEISEHFALSDCAELERTHENKIVETDGISTYVPYREVCENEFFAETQAGLDAFLALKEQMLKRY